MYIRSYNLPVYVICRPQPRRRALSATRYQLKREEKTSPNKKQNFKLVTRHKK